jgi:hypothetical protein
MTRLHDETARLAGPGPHQDQDQDQVQAHLRQRGQAIAQDLDLVQLQDQDLIRLGELDAIAQHPGLNPKLAISLETIAAGLDHYDGPTWAERYEQHRGHGHGINVTCNLDQPAPEPGTTDTPDIPDMGRARLGGRGRSARGRAQSQKPAVRNEKVDPIKDYLRRVPDPPDEDWS